MGCMWAIYKIVEKSVINNSIDIELMDKIEQEYVDSCWKLASGLDTYLVAENDSSSICKYWLLLI